jgi:hypothetical protein
MPYCMARNVELHGGESSLGHALTGTGSASTGWCLQALLTGEQIPGLGAVMGVYPAPRSRWDYGYPSLNGVCFHLPNL